MSLTTQSRGHSTRSTSRAKKRCRSAVPRLDVGKLYEAQRRRVHAVAPARRLWAIVEDVAEVGVAFCAGDGSADHTEARVAQLGDIFCRNGLPETGPSGAGIEFGSGIEQRVIATDAAVEAFVMQIPVLAGEGHFGVSVPRDVVSVGGELCTPLLRGLHDFGNMHFLEMLAGVGKKNNGDVFEFRGRSSLEDARLGPLPQRETGKRRG